MEYTELTIHTTVEHLETATAIATSCGDGGLYIEDYSDLGATLPRERWCELIDDQLLRQDRESACIHLYLSAAQHPAECRETLIGLLNAAGISYTLEKGSVQDSDWSESWKQYYKPEHAGCVVIRPSWHDYQPKPDEIVVDLDPGMAFGTGQHESTKLCLLLLQRYLVAGDGMLDMGCGSGVLSVAALKMGAGRAIACDRDADAVRTAVDNAIRNGLDSRQFVGVCADILLQPGSFPDLSGPFQIIACNIIADVIMEMSGFFCSSLSADGMLLVSGIIDSRADEVREHLMAAGFKPVEAISMGGWRALALRKSH